MKRKLLLAASAVLVTAAIGVGTTMALFTATTGNSNSTYTAGTLCLDSERNDGDTVPGPMFYVTAAQGATPPPLSMPGIYPTGEWAPGDENTRTLTVKNPTSCSTMSAWLDTIEASLQPGSYVPMADKLWVEVYTPQSGPEVKVAEGWLSAFLAGPISAQYPDGSKIPLYLSSNRHMKFKVKFDLSADNSYQGQTLVADFTVNGIQMPNNP